MTLTWTKTAYAVCVASMSQSDNVFTRLCHWVHMYRRKGVATMPFRLWFHWMLTGRYPR